MLAFNIGENVLRDLGASDLAGDYTVACYYADLDRPENAEFLRRLRAKFGPQRRATDPMESAYNSVHIWAKAVEAAGDPAPSVVASAVGGVAWEGPGGPVHVDRDNLHIWTMVRLARIGADGRFEVVWSSDKPVRPEPYPKKVISVKIFEYLACEKPVVGALSGESARVLRDSQGGIVVPLGDARATADAILTLYHSPERRALMGKLGRRGRRCPACGISP